MKQSQLALVSLFALVAVSGCDLLDKDPVDCATARRSYSLAKQSVYDASFAEGFLNASALVAWDDKAEAKKAIDELINNDEIHKKAIGDLDHSVNQLMKHCGPSYPVN